MTDQERWQWEERLKSGGDDAIAAILDRVEQLERELAAAREAYDSLSKIDTELIEKLIMRTLVSPAGLP